MNRHEAAIRDDVGRAETFVTPMDGGEDQAVQEIAALVAERYQTTETVIEEAICDA